MTGRRPRPRPPFRHTKQTDGSSLFKFFLRQWQASLEWSIYAVSFPLLKKSGACFLQFLVRLMQPCLLPGGKNRQVLGHPALPKTMLLEFQRLLEATTRLIEEEEEEEEEEKANLDNLATAQPILSQA